MIVMSRGGQWPNVGHMESQLSTQQITFNIIYIMRTNIDKGGICCFMVILVLLNNDASKPFQAQLPQQR